MIAPEVLDALLAAGATAEMIVAAVKADAQQEMVKADERRSKDRERQKRHRASRTVTVTSRDNCDSPSPLSPPLKTPPDPLKIPPPITPQPEDMSAEPTPLTPDEIVEAWNERMAPKGFPPVRKLTGTRQRQLKARIRENTLDEWQQAMSALERSPFCRGENERGWKADFDFLLQPKSFTKLLEGAYDH